MTKKTPEELKAAVIEQGIKLAGEMHPHTTTAQRERIGVALWATMNDFTKNIETLALGLECNRHTIEFDIVGKHPHLIRDVPSKESALAFKLAELEQQTETPADGVTRLNLSRQIGKLSGDQLLELVPHDWKAPTVEDVPPPATKTINTGKLSYEDVAETMGVPVHQVKVSDFVRLNKAAKHVPEGQEQNARDADQLGRLDRPLSAIERLTQHRIAQQQKKAS